MLKSILTSAIIIALTMGISYSIIAQPKAVKVDSKTAATANKTDEIKPATDVDRTKKRIEMQVQRYTKDYNLTEKQQKSVAEILTAFENQSNDLKAKLNDLNKEKNDKIESLLTDEQKKMKEQALKEKREKLMERRNETKNDGEKKELPKSISVPQNK
ncbi:MAG: hypothetical protein LBS41_01880 [Streptococcaceae bacterium]|jgi:hypothetical protein|nr:hypothetical protein [Streptococcaceae bacterium]